MDRVHQDLAVFPFFLCPLVLVACGTVRPPDPQPYMPLTVHLLLLGLRLFRLFDPRRATMWIVLPSSASLTFEPLRSQQLQTSPAALSRHSRLSPDRSFSFRLLSTSLHRRRIFLRRHLWKCFTLRLSLHLYLQDFVLLTMLLISGTGSFRSIPSFANPSSIFRARSHCLP